MEAVSGLEGELEELRETFRSGKTKEVTWRRSQLQALLSLLREREGEILEALKQDIGKHPVESYRDEIGTVVKSVNYALGGLNQWMSSKKAKLPIVAFPATAELVPEPLGLVLIISSWNFPFGSARVGKIVMTAAAKHLTPVTLELGGKCPAVVDELSSSWDIEMTIRRILAGKFGICAGQVCIGIDYILVEEKFKSTLVQQMEVFIKKVFGEDPKETNSIARIINKNHLMRLKNLLDEPLVKASIVYGGSIDEDHLFIEPTILVDPPLKAAIMNEEIFGPLLPIITLEKIEDSIEFIKSRPRPLTIYAFTKNEKLKGRLISETSSGSLIFNDTIIQYVADSIPFGGVGESGFGRYHGKFSFDTFTHEKAVMKRNFLTDVWFRLPPWNDHKLELFRSIYRYDYLDLVLITLGIKKKAKKS
ncbi:aldehyde dehydrogenase family 3 member F1-like isoform X2 [Rhododendron vialii]|uniref:aldehyde dehydrogenase family 3 member F1-like isoform X2 n=1 Tax=Rhododendron vialii TaxID=182163 RepID=UPI00265DBE20|nr:aldehyde dehydrogenase family 3 member F1-like isoform X2 [Rhododendron vialii]